VNDDIWLALITAGVVVAAIVAAVVAYALRRGYRVDLRPVPPAAASARAAVAAVPDRRSA
jgi:hypothetical protein